MDVRCCAVRGGPSARCGAGPARVALAPNHGRCLIVPGMLAPSSGRRSCRLAVFCPSAERDGSSDSQTPAKLSGQRFQQAAQASSTQLPIEPWALVQRSCGFYVAMIIASVGLGEANGHMGLYHMLEPQGGADLAAVLGFGVLWTLPLLASLFWITENADDYPALKELKMMFAGSITPILAALPPLGLLLLALGAGWGEEMLFRAFLQDSMVDWLSPKLGIASGASALMAASVVFGAMHAVTPVYFFWATGAGLLLGLEYIVHGLQAAAVTHSLYDFLAFLYMVKLWPDDSEAMQNSKDAPTQS